MLDMASTSALAPGPADLSRKLAVSALCASFFGVCITTYVMFVPGHPYLTQVLASAIKVPIILLLSYSVSTAIFVVIAHFILRALSPTSILSLTSDCLIVTATTLGGLGPLLALIASRGNYSVLIYSAYSAFALSGVAGCVEFYRRVRSVHRRCRRRTLLLASAVWLCLFGALECQIGWSLRPIVGWTGQNFTWFRHDDAKIWNQMVCEGRNLEHGGVSFPAAGQQNDATKGPC
jgi:hypothetical protein